MGQMINYYTCITGYSCNNACIFCTRPNDPNIPNVWGFVPDKSTQELFEELERARKSFNGVILTGGEPSIREDFLEILKKCVELGFEKVSIQTNARRFSDKEFAEQAIKILGKRADFYVSIHAHKKELFNMLSGTDAYEEAITGLKNLLSSGTQVRANTVVMKPNYKHLPEIASFLCNLGLRELEFMFVHPNGRAWINRKQIVPRIETVISFVKKAIDVAVEFDVAAKTSFFPICALGEYKDKATELYLQKNMFLTNLNIRRKQVGCDNCKYNANCWGLWSRYMAIHEFKCRPQ